MGPALSNEGLLRARHVGSQTVDTSLEKPTTHAGNLPNAKRARNLSVGTKESRPALKNGLPSPLPSEDGNTTRVPDNTSNLQDPESQLFYRRTYTQPNSIFDYKTSVFIPKGPIRKPSDILFSTLEKRDRRPSRPLNNRSRLLLPAPPAVKPQTAPPMGQTLSNLRHGRFGSSKIRDATTPQPEKRSSKLDRLRKAQGSPGINKQRSPKSSPRASINLRSVCIKTKGDMEN